MHHDVNGSMSNPRKNLNMSDSIAVLRLGAAAAPWTPPASGLQTLLGLQCAAIVREPRILMYKRYQKEKVRNASRYQWNYVKSYEKPVSERLHCSVAAWRRGHRVDTARVRATCPTFSAHRLLGNRAL